MQTLKPLLTLLFLLAISDVCHAQGLFGQRDLGSSLGKRNGPGNATATVDAGRRFARGARSATDVVGTNTSAEAMSGFVGGQSAVTAVTSSVAGLIEEARPPINRPRIIRPAGLYAERLTLASDASTLANSVQQQQLSESLQSLVQSRSVTIAVSPEGHSATLRGAVPSEHERQTTELLVMFEPGIQKVENELTVDPTLPPVQRRPRVPMSN